MIEILNLQIKQILIVCFTLFFFFSCQKTPTIPEKPQGFRQEKITPEEAKTFHQDKEFEYEYRTGNSGHYEYNYDVKGEDENGNEVSGKINIEGKYGAGKIDDQKGNIHNVEVEWYDKGKLKAVDEKGKRYELVVE